MQERLRMEDAIDREKGYEQGQRIAERVGGGGEEGSSMEEEEEEGEGMDVGDDDDDDDDRYDVASGDGMDSHSG
jgi:hypothetical protein